MRALHSDNRVSSVLDFFTAAQRRQTDSPFVDRSIFVCQPLSELIQKEQVYLSMWQATSLPHGCQHAESISALLQRAPIIFSLNHRLEMSRYTICNKVSQGDPVRIEVDRTNLLATAMQAFSNMSRAQRQRPVKVTFKGEKGIDIDGVRREFITLVCKELFSKKVGS